MWAFTMLVLTKYQRIYFHILTEKQPTSHFDVQVIMTVHNISCICCTVEYFVADLLGSHYSAVFCLCKQHILGIKLPPNFSCHLGIICKHPRSFYQAYESHLEDGSHSLILSNCIMFYKPVSPSRSRQM